MNEIITLVNNKATSWWSNWKNKALVILAIAFLISLAFNIHYNLTDGEVKVVEKETIVTKIDTIHDTIPVVKYEKLIRYERDTLKQYITKYDTIYTENGKFDKIVETVDTALADVEIPITQKVYHKDSLYTAYVSGYRQNLDSINVYNKTVYVNKEITVTKKDNKRFGIGPVIYGGYDIQGNKFGWGVGIGIQYNIFKF